MDQTFYVPYPDAKIFAGNGAPKTVTDVGPLATYEFDRAEYPETGGILVYKKGLLFPTKGFVFPQAVQCVQVAKRIFIDILFFAKSWQLFPVYLILLCLPFKSKIKFFNKIILYYNRACIRVVKAVAPDRKYLIDISQELWTMIETFLVELGFIPNEASTFARIFAVSINYDNAYHLRLVDIFSEVNRATLLDHPREEIKRVLQIFVSREKSRRVKDKIKLFTWALRLAFFSKRITKAFRKAIEAATWEKVCYDSIWRYNTLERDDYNFMGKTWEERQEIFAVLHNNHTPQPLNV